MNDININLDKINSDVKHQLATKHKLALVASSLSIKMGVLCQDSWKGTKISAYRSFWLNYKKNILLSINCVQKVINAINENIEEYQKTEDDITRDISDNVSLSQSNITSDADVNNNIEENQESENVETNKFNYDFSKLIGRDLSILNRPIGKVVNEEKLNSDIKSNVETYNRCTRESVVATLTTLTSTLADSGYTLAYDLSGSYIDSKTAVNSNWGKSYYNERYKKTQIHGLDCSDLFRWAAYQAGFDDIASTPSKQAKYGSYKEHEMDGSFIGKPGDLLFKEGTEHDHVKIILGDCDEGYYVLEETNPCMKVSVMPHDYNDSDANTKGEKYYVVNMDDFYSNESLKRENNP